MKNTICKIFAHFLYRGMKVLYKKDERVKNEIDQIANGTCFVLKFDLPENASFIAIEKTASGLKKRKEIRKGDIVITFKSLDLAYNVITGKKGLCQSYAEHDFMLDGNIYDTMAFTRIVELVEAHLFSKKKCSKILREVPKRSISVFSAYVLAIFGN